MNCDEYRSKTFSEHWDSPNRKAYKRHGMECRSCKDWKSTNRIITEGFDPADFPCVHIASHVLGFNSVNCYDNSNRSPVLITYDLRTNDFHIQIDNIQRWRINNCPWCGIALPPSEALRWYDELLELGFDDPEVDAIPAAYRTDEWRNRA